MVLFLDTRGQYSEPICCCMIVYVVFVCSHSAFVTLCTVHTPENQISERLYVLFVLFFFVFQRKVVILFSSSQHLWLALSVRDSLIWIVSDGWYWCIVWSKHGCVLHRGYVFRAQTQEIKERGGNQTTGIDFFITQERVIFLDTQVRMKCHRCCDSRVFDLLSECITSE